MTCTFQCYRIRITLIFVLCKAVLLKYNCIALGLKYFAPLYGSLNHHRLKVDLRRCHRGQLGLDHHCVCVAYSGTTIRRKKLRRFKLLLARKCNMYNTYGWRRKWGYYDDTHISRKREEKRKIEKSNWCYHPTNSHFTKGECIESCGTIHHRHLVNPTASSCKQHHHTDLNWRTTSVEFLKAGLSLPDNSHFLPICNDGGGLDCRSIIPPSNNNGEYTADNFTLNVGKLLESLPEDSRLIFRREPDLSQFSDSVMLIDYGGRTLLRGLHLYKVFCCFLRFMGRITGVDPLVIIEVHFNKLENCIDIRMVVKFGTHNRMNTISKYKLEEKTGMVVSHSFTNRLFRTTTFIRSWYEHIVASWARRFSGKGAQRR